MRMYESGRIVVRKQDRILEILRRSPWLKTTAIGERLGMTHPASSLKRLVERGLIESRDSHILNERERRAL